MELAQERDELRPGIETVRRGVVQMLQAVSETVQETIGRREAVLAELRRAEQQLGALQANRSLVEALDATRERVDALSKGLDELQSQRLQVLLATEKALRDALELRESLAREVAELQRRRDALATELGARPAGVTPSALPPSLRPGQPVDESAARQVSEIARASGSPDEGGTGSNEEWERELSPEPPWSGEIQGSKPPADQARLNRPPPVPPSPRPASVLAVDSGRRSFANLGFTIAAIVALLVLGLIILATLLPERFGW